MSDTAYIFVTIVAIGALALSLTAYFKIRRLERYYQRQADRLKPKHKGTPHMRRDLSGL